jgi:5'-AMP-activated protein kinase catalytic alpha subunit
MGMRKVGKYELGRTIGEGTFAKVKFAQNSETGESVAMKILDKETILKHKMVDQVSFLPPPLLLPFCIVLILISLVSL